MPSSEATEPLRVSLILIFTLSFITYVCLYKLLCRALFPYFARKGDHDLQDNLLPRTISMRVVSSIQAILACLCGAIIVSECHHNKLHARSSLVEPYGVSMIAYLWYDTCVMFSIFLVKNQQSDQQPVPASLSLLYRFISENIVMMVHHIILPVLLSPVLLLYRGGVGDFYIGMFLFIEAFIPFASMRDIFVLLDCKYSTLYILNGILTVVIFTVCRICLFPLMYWFHGQDIDQPFYMVPWYIPRVCNIGTCGLCVLFIYWWCMILRIMVTELKDLRKLSESKSSKANNTMIQEKKAD